MSEMSPRVPCSQLVTLFCKVVETVSQKRITEDNSLRIKPSSVFCFLIEQDL
ncbi:mCG148203 [Mus musculus]|nr:mCG148203 [Mus musculus]